MKAIVYDHHGPADALQLRDIPRPWPKSNEILIKVQASSVNPVDWKIRRGDLKIVTAFSFPRVPGCDFAGVVEETGSAVSQYKPGDAVFGIVNAATTRYGSAAEYMVAREKQTARKPETVSFLDAAAIPCAGLTAWHALRDMARVKAGNSVLINGASGGVGSFAVQLAKTLGVAVTAVCSADNVEYVKGLGADHVVDYRVQDVQRLEERFDAIFDAAATLSFTTSKHLLKHVGVYVTTLPTPEAFLSMAVSLVLPGKRAKIVMLNGLKPVPQALAELADLMVAGKLRANVETVVPLEELRQAHLQSETGHARGKIGVRIA